jgi:hypothetical protein
MANLRKQQNDRSKSNYQKPYKLFKKLVALNLGSLSFRFDAYIKSESKK